MTAGLSFIRIDQSPFLLILLGVRFQVCINYLLKNLFHYRTCRDVHGIRMDQVLHLNSQFHAPSPLPPGL